MVNPDKPRVLRNTARGIVVHEGKLLLMERWRPGRHYFSIPGGGIEAGESPEQTVVREILEETTLEVEVERLILVMEDSDYKNYIYLCQYLSGEPELAATAPEAIQASPDNRFKPGWVTVDRAQDLPFYYWEPLKQHIVSGLKDGFAIDPVTVTINR